MCSHFGWTCYSRKIAMMEVTTWYCMLCWCVLSVRVEGRLQQLQLEQPSWQQNHADIRCEATRCSAERFTAEHHRRASGRPIPTTAMLTTCRLVCSRVGHGLDHFTGWVGWLISSVGVFYQFDNRLPNVYSVQPNVILLYLGELWLHDAMAQRLG